MKSLVIQEKLTNFAPRNKQPFTVMKKIYRLSLLTICFLLSMTALTSCEFDTSPEPDYPKYVTYTISVGHTSYSGPDAFLSDIMTWVKDNQVIYDTPANYTTGAPSEFTQQDAEAVQKYNAFVPKVKAYFEEMRGKLNNKVYGDSPKVNGTFYVFVTRGQGQGRDLKSETITFVYP